MRIIVYTSEDAPIGKRVCARFLQGKSILPVFIYSAIDDEDDAREEAQKWWDAEAAKLSKKRKPEAGIPASKPEAEIDEDDLL